MLIEKLEMVKCHLSFQQLVLVRRYESSSWMKPGYLVMIGNIALAQGQIVWLQAMLSSIREQLVVLLRAWENVEQPTKESLRASIDQQLQLVYPTKALSQTIQKLKPIEKLDHLYFRRKNETCEILALLEYDKRFFEQFCGSQITDDLDPKVTLAEILDSIEIVRSTRTKDTLSISKTIDTIGVKLREEK